MTEIPNKARMMFVTANLKGKDNNNKRIKTKAKLFCDSCFMSFHTLFKKL